MFTLCYYADKSYSINRNIIYAYAVVLWTRGMSHDCGIMASSTTTGGYACAQRFICFNYSYNVSS